MIRVLGIDPGLAHTGFGVIEIYNSKIHYLDHGEFTTSSELTVGNRLEKIYTELISLIRQYKPTESGIESLYFTRNSKSAIPVAQARGVILLALAQKGVYAREYTPQEIKQAIVGSGRAEKSQVQEFVKILLGLTDIPCPDHAGDALAAAICHFHNGYGKPYSIKKDSTESYYDK
ncbi:MAG: crossover junction endodeoxyribonuclease RuvC [Spirochaetes bacterium]|nr:MAG: crossover junction endodeoxyribonuclease RuvC [Spirochaetota bacterium]